MCASVSGVAIVAKKEFTRIPNSNVFVLHPCDASEIDEYLDKCSSDRQARARRSNLRINSRVMGCAEKFAAEFLRHSLVTGQAPIDSDYIQRNSIELAKAMVAGFVDERLF